MRLNYGLIIGTIIVIFFINKYLNEQKEIPVQVEEPTELVSAIEEGDIQKPIEQLKPKKKVQFVETATEIKPEQNSNPVDYPETTTITQKLSKLKELLPQPIRDTIDTDKFMIVRNKMNQPMKPQVVKSDGLSPNPIGSTEYRFVEENPKLAWSDINVSQHPEHHTSNITDELTNSGGFFDNDDDNFYHDRTSHKSKTNLPDRCFMNKNNEVICSYNNRLQNIPPQLIQDKKNNNVLNSIGEGTNLYKGVDTSNVNTINGSQYQVWGYNGEKTINGGLYYGNVSASDSQNEDYLAIKSIDERPNYSF